MRLTIKEIKAKLAKLGLVNPEKEAVLYSVFKNRASVHRYGIRRTKYKVVYIGHPKENLFGFYTMYGTDSEVMKEAYGLYLRLMKGDMEPYIDGDVQWGNAGIPLAYGNLRVS